MDEQAAKEYFALLQRKLEVKSSDWNEFLFVPILAASGFFVFGSIAGSVFGAMIGWGICACLIRLKIVKKEIYLAEFSRHLHEYTDQAEDGLALGNTQSSVERTLMRKWFS